jgi:hypothetical protein
MQIFWLPQNICDIIDQTTRNFIWRDANNKGIHLICWEKTARPKYQGGLGIRTSRENNICLLWKLVWDVLQYSNRLWVDLQSDKYHDGTRLLYATARPSDSSTWSAIIHAKNCLKSSFSWRTGSDNFYFRYYPWSTPCYLGTLVPYIGIHDIHLSVKMC